MSTYAVFGMTRSAAFELACKKSNRLKNGELLRDALDKIGLSKK